MSWLVNMVNVIVACILSFNVVTAVVSALGSHCGQYEYSLSDNLVATCDLCQPGYHVLRHCNRTHGTVCVRCEPYTFNSVCNRATTCQDCAETCETRYGVEMKRLCSPISDLECGCPHRMFRTGKYDWCKEHTACPAGSGVSKIGTGKSDTECVLCEPGTFSDLQEQNYEAACRPWSSCSDGYMTDFGGNTTHDVTCLRNSSYVTIATEDGGVSKTLLRDNWIIPVCVGVPVVILVVVVIVIICWIRRRRAKSLTNRPVVDGDQFMVKGVAMRDDPENGLGRNSLLHNAMDSGCANDFGDCDGGFCGPSERCADSATAAGDGSGNRSTPVTKQEIKVPVIQLRDPNTFGNAEAYTNYLAQACAGYLEENVIGEHACAFLRELGLLDADIEYIKFDNVFNTREFLHQGMLKFAQAHPGLYSPTKLIKAATKVTKENKQKAAFLQYLAQVFTVEDSSRNMKKKDSVSVAYGKQSTTSLANVLEQYEMKGTNTTGPAERTKISGRMASCSSPVGSNPTQIDPLRVIIDNIQGELQSNDRKRFLSFIADPVGKADYNRLWTEFEGEDGDMTTIKVFDTLIDKMGKKEAINVFINAFRLLDGKHMSYGQYKDIPIHEILTNYLQDNCHRPEFEERT